MEETASWPVSVVCECSLDNVLSCKFVLLAEHEGGNILWTFRNAKFEFLKVCFCFDELL